MTDVFQYACRLLSRREYSVAELQDRLEKKFSGEGDIAPVMARLVAENLVCDERFAEAFARSRMARLQGPRKIRAELSGRRVAASQVDAIIERQAEVWTDLARTWLERQGFAGDDYEARAKYYRRLVNRGFTHDQAMDALAACGADGDGV